MDIRSVGSSASILVRHVCNWCSVPPRLHSSSPMFTTSCRGAKSRLSCASASSCRPISLKNRNQTSVNHWRPKMISSPRHASDHESNTAGFCTLRMMLSGAMKPREPHDSYRVVSSSMSHVNPRSITFTPVTMYVPSGRKSCSTSTFSLFISRCAYPSLCSDASPSHTLVKMITAFSYPTPRFECSPNFIKSNTSRPNRSII
mmetsp:Transcript_87132/g.247303  ORF Transcript_87132/g.247303 Transcript_87132/m.247303 type:complete len:202 (+) Transcript_87132:666-1271(+)